MEEIQTEDQIGKGALLLGLELTKSVAKLKKLKVCWLIEVQNAQIQKQGPKWKTQPTLGLAFEFGRDAIELILKIKISIEGLIEQIKN